MEVRRYFHTVYGKNNQALLDKIEQSFDELYFPACPACSPCDLSNHTSMIQSLKEAVDGQLCNDDATDMKQLKEDLAHVKSALISHGKKLGNLNLSCFAPTHF